MGKHLHIICHTVPWPADFGGVQDIFNSITALHRQGVRIHLHCFTKNMNVSIGPLQNYCEEIHLYKRKTGIKNASTTLPYIVNSRRSKKLVSRLELDKHPLLIQGVHCSLVLKKIGVSQRKIIIRLFNVETNYYNSLANLEKHLGKKIYYRAEAKLLKTYEANLAKQYSILSISETDRLFYKENFNANNVRFLPAFTGNKQLNSKKGTGTYILYQANLSVNENDAIAKWLIQKIAPAISFPIKIAGKNPSDRLLKLASDLDNVEIIGNPNIDIMQELIIDAQINLVPSFNNTGVKLKLLNALFMGRHCITNAAGAAGSGLESLVHFAESIPQTLQLIDELKNRSVTTEEMEERKNLLAQMYNDDKNALTICDLLL